MNQSTQMYSLTHEQVSLIKTLLQKEKIEYKYVEHKENGSYFNLIDTILREMGTTQKHKTD